MKPEKTAQQIHAEVIRLVDGDHAVQEVAFEILLPWPSRQPGVDGGANWSIRYDGKFFVVVALAVAHVQAMWDLRTPRQ